MRNDRTIRHSHSSPALAVSRVQAVHRVPMEILQKIFFLCDDASVGSRHAIADARKKSPAPPYAWLAVTEVCRRWYNASIGYGPLWSTFVLPSLRSREFFELSLRRSKASPLTISFFEVPIVDDVSDEDSDDEVDEWYRGSPTEDSMANVTSWFMLRKLLREPGRVQEIHVGTYTISGHTDAVKLLSTLGPRLRSCSLATEPSSFRGAAMVPSFPAGRQNLPGLQHLRLYGLRAVHWDRISPLVGLVSLDVRFEPTAHLLVSRLLECLAHLPLLEILSLANLKVHPEVGDATRLVSMDNMRKIELSADPTFCSELLRRLRLPPDVHLSLEYEDINPYSSFHITEPFSPLRSLPTSPKSLMLQPVSGLRMHAWASHLSLTPNMRWEDDRMLDLTTQIPYKPSIASLLADWPLPEVRLLILKSGEPPVELEERTAYEIDLKMAAAEMHAWTQCMPHLVELRLWPTEESHFPLVKLFCGSAIPAWRSESPLPWPTLQVLVLYEVDPNDAVALRGVAAVLQLRERKGCARLSRLVLHLAKGVVDECNRLSLLSDCADEIVKVTEDIDAEELCL